MSLRLYDLLEKTVYFQISGVLKAQRSGEHNRCPRQPTGKLSPSPVTTPLLTSRKSLACFRCKVTSPSPSGGPREGPRAERMRVNNQEPPLPTTHHRPHCDIPFTHCSPVSPGRDKARGASRFLTAEAVTQPEQLPQSRDERIKSFRVTTEFPTFTALIAGCFACCLCMLCQDVGWTKELFGVGRLFSMSGFFPKAGIFGNFPPLCGLSLSPCAASETRLPTGPPLPPTLQFPSPAPQISFLPLCCSYPRRLHTASSPARETQASSPYCLPVDEEAVLAVKLNEWLCLQNAQFILLGPQ